MDAPDDEDDDDNEDNKDDEDDDNNEDDKDDASSCYSDHSAGDSENDDGDSYDDVNFDGFFDDYDFDLNDLREADANSATNETCSPSHTHDSTATAVGPPQPLIPSQPSLSPARPNQLNQTASTSQPLHTNGYVVVGDNIDKNVRPSFQRHDRTTQSLHYFHSYAVLDRINVAGLSDDLPSSIDISPEKILPSADDVEKLLGDFEVLVARY